MTDHLLRFSSGHLFKSDKSKEMGKKKKKKDQGGQSENSVEKNES